MLASQLRYLNKSPKGMYEYRRRVPTNLRQYFSRTASGRLMTEWKKALIPTVEAEARKRWYVENERFEAALTLAELLRTNPEDAPASAHIARAKELVRQFGVNPDDAPTLGPQATDADIEVFRAKSRAWNAKVSEFTDSLIDTLEDLTEDREQQQRDYDSGRWGQPGYVNPRRGLDARDRHLDVALQIISGEVIPPAKHVWRDAVELYIATNKRETNREVEKARRWEVKTRNLLEKFGYAMGGMNKPLDEMERTQIINWLWREYPAAPTRNRYINTFSAVMNCWNRETKEQIYNPFSGLSNKQHEKEEGLTRRSFKPTEWFAYLDAVETSQNIEIKIVGLLMLFTGCRLNEAAGLEV